MVAALLTCLLVLVAQAQASTSLLTPEQTENLLTELPKLLKQHSSRKLFPPPGPTNFRLKDLQTRPLRNELFCRCTEPNCDAELLDIGGPTYKGVCRALGGVCRKSIELAPSGEAREISLSCAMPSELQPPERPFICESIKSDRVNQIIECCSNRSFCNDMDIQVI